MLNKINKDIALWKTAQEEEKISDAWQNVEEENNENEEEEDEDRYYFEPVEDEE